MDRASFGARDAANIYLRAIGDGIRQALPDTSCKPAVIKNVAALGHCHDFAARLAFHLLSQTVR
ncbi:hypothetical protein FJ546_07395 [Mesorhizobium sp. B2-4-19]|uniref:hypothetical protein n=1 Tax=Mesorhizobium sp. B2-4-19 TaxID=2589930 RepID=UPI00112DE14D|nr:hypothetical protein [Mesorhizobium sp. B2-4-19]TPK66569.1 hypothetical protein FJ546_07395 [Mesorhizobium sp. B2-4-19]